MTTMTSRSAASSASAAHASRTRRPRSTSDSPPVGRPGRVGLPAGPHVARHVAQRGAVELAVVELDPPLVDLDRPTERLRRLAGAAQRAADRPGRRAARRRARPPGGDRARRAPGSSRRPSSSPDAFASVRPWRTTISMPSSSLIPARCRARRDRFGGTRRARSGSSRRNRRYSHQHTAAPISSSTTLNATAAELRQLGGRPLEAERRPPERLGVGPRTVEDEVEQHPDRHAEPAALQHPPSAGGEHHDRERRPPRRPGRGGAAARRSGARPAGGRCRGRPAGSRRTGCGRPPTR